MKLTSEHLAEKLEELRAMYDDFHKSGTLNIGINNRHIPELTNHIPWLLDTIAALQKALGEKNEVTQS